MEPTSKKQSFVGKFVRFGLVGVVVAVVGLTALVGRGASSADASHNSITSGTLAAPWGGYAYYTYNYATYDLSGVVFDQAADGYCVQVYDRGYNWILGWGSWKYLGQACGKGVGRNFGEHISVYSDKVDLKVCVAHSSVRTPSGGWCTSSKRIWG